MAGIEKLTALKVSKTAKAGKYSDGKGLYLQVTKQLVKSWVFRYERGGSEHFMGLGPTHSVGLAEAREELVGRGLAVSEVQDMGGVLYAYFADPDGNSWALQQIGAAARPRCRRCTAASASWSGTPRCTKSCAVVDFPIPIEPVRPSTKVMSAPANQAFRISASISARSAGVTCGVTPNQRAKPGTA